MDPFLTLVALFIVAAVIGVCVELRMWNYEKRLHERARRRRVEEMCRHLDSKRRGR